jgi:hypothetical protein
LNWNPFNPVNPNVPVRFYPGGDGGLTNLCTLYPKRSTNLCGGPSKSDCTLEQYLPILLGLLVLLYFLFVEQPTSS